MAYEYLDGLPITDAQRTLLRGLAARTPEALLSMMEHSRDRFDRYLGSDTAAAVCEALKKLVPQSTQDAWAEAPDFHPATGAKISTPTPPAWSATEQRDKLLKELQFLRSQPQQTPEVQEAVRQIEDKLRATLQYTLGTSASTS